MIEKGTHIRVKIIGIRPDVGKMYAVGSIQEDYLGFVSRTQQSGVELTDSKYPVLNLLRSASKYLSTS